MGKRVFFQDEPHRQQQHNTQYVRLNSNSPHFLFPPSPLSHSPILQDHVTLSPLVLAIMTVPLRYTKRLSIVWGVLCGSLIFIKLHMISLHVKAVVLSPLDIENSIVGWKR